MLRKYDRRSTARWVSATVIAAVMASFTASASAATIATYTPQTGYGAVFGFEQGHASSQFTQSGSFMLAGDSSEGYAVASANFPPPPVSIPAGSSSATVTMRVTFDASILGHALSFVSLAGGNACFRESAFNPNGHQSKSTTVTVTFDCPEVSDHLLSIQATVGAETPQLQPRANARFRITGQIDEIRVDVP